MDTVPIDGLHDSSDLFAFAEDFFGINHNRHSNWATGQVILKPSESLSKEDLFSRYYIAVSTLHHLMKKQYKYGVLSFPDE